MNTPPTYDALLVISFGGPEQAEDVMPFLERVTRGRSVPRQRLEEVAKHYYKYGGKSPINDHNRELIESLRKELQASGTPLPIYFGNRNWHPLIEDTLQEMAQAGVKRALAFVTSAYSSYSGCRQYREAIESARRQVSGAPEVEVIRRFFNHPGFVSSNIDRVRAALSELEPEKRAGARIVFTAHSIPLSMARNCNYELQLREVARLVAHALNRSEWDLVWQSRSGPPQVPWLEPDILDHLRTLRSAGQEAVVVAPIGFTSDHMEVVYDLDDEARELCESIGLQMVRARTAGTHPRFVRMIVELIQERTQRRAPEAIGQLTALPTPCPVGCCPAPARPAPRPPQD